MKNSVSAISSSCEDINQNFKAAKYHLLSHGLKDFSLIKSQQCVFLFKINFFRSKGISNTTSPLCSEMFSWDAGNISFFKILPSEFMISIRHEKTLLFRRGVRHFGFYAELFTRKKRISIWRNANNTYVLCFCLE